MTKVELLDGPHRGQIVECPWDMAQMQAIVRRGITTLGMTRTDGSVVFYEWTEIDEENDPPQWGKACWLRGHRRFDLNT